MSHRSRMVSRETSCLSRPKIVFSYLALGVVLLASGCERRNFFRRQADAEVNCIVQQTTSDPRYALPGVSVSMDPRSRYYDPYDPDRPPMPADDPASNQYMKCVNGMRGYDGWECDGVIDDLENPDWRARLGEYVPLNEEGAIVLNVDSALQLAYVNSTGYQRSLEELYLSALDVSAERFRFQTQFFGGNDTSFQASGTGFNNSSPSNPFGTAVNGFTELENSTDISVDRRFATAGTLAVDFANSFVWQFSGADTNSAFSFASFNLIQPLLRNGGRIIALETLTIAERTMLANLRTFQRYRQGFYTNVAIGNGTGGPSRRGGFAGGTGLTGFVGQGSGGFGGVGGATGFGRGGAGGIGGGGGGGGAGGLAGGGAGNVGGFIGLLQSRQQYLNDIANYRLQQRTFEELQANFEAGLIDSTQVDQFRQTLQTQQSTLTQSLFGLESQIQGYLTGTLSLPPDVPVELDDSFIQPFQLITPEMGELQDRVNDLQTVLGSEQEFTVDELNQILTEVQAMYLDFVEYLNVIDQDKAAMEAGIQQRIQSMSADDRQRFMAELTRQVEQYDDYKVRLVEFQDRLTEIVNSVAPDNRERVRIDLTTWRRDFAVWAQELALVHARFRLESITLNTVDVDLRTALQIARINRVDLMNNRADLVNTWRLIAFNANRLQSDLTISANGNISTDGDNPLNFSRDNTNLNLGVQFDAPLTRLLERNNYRSALISYQRDRRQYIQFEDQLKFSIWQILEQLKVSEENLELQRQAVVIAIRRVDNTQMELNAPPQRDGTTGQVLPRGPTVVQNLLSALNDLRNTQNNFMSVWLNYYSTRMLLLRELGIMELDEEGRWMDMPVNWQNFMPTEAIELPPGVPNEWMHEAFPEGVPQEQLMEQPMPEQMQNDEQLMPIPAEENPMQLNQPAQPMPLNTAARGMQPLRIENRIHTAALKNSGQPTQGGGSLAARANAVPARPVSTDRIAGSQGPSGLSSTTVQTEAPRESTPRNAFPQEVEPQRTVTKSSNPLMPPPGAVAREYRTQTQMANQPTAGQEPRR